MAPKNAKRLAPPPPPSDSSETSGSGSDVAEEEEETAHSPPPTAPKQKGREPEASDDDDDDEEEGDEEDERPNHVAPHSAKKNPPPPKREPETSDEEDGEADGEMPRPKPAPKLKQEAGEKGAKPSSSIQDKARRAPFQRTWSTDDDVRILEALAAHRREHGMLPRTDALAAALAGTLDKRDCSHLELEKKVKSLRSRYSTATKKGELRGRDHSRRLFYLSKSVWGNVSKAAAANRVPLREVSEMCKLYPYLAEEVRALEKAHPGLFKREFEMVDDDKARALDEKIKKQRRSQMKVYQHRYDLIKEVTKTLIDLDSQGK